MNETAEVRKIGPWSMIFLFLNLSLAKNLLVVPSYYASDMGNSAWIAALLKGLAAGLMFTAIAALYRPYTALGLGEVNRRAFGKLFGSIFNIIIAAFIIVRGAFLFRTLAEALRLLEVDTASLEYLAIFTLIPVTVCAVKGFNTNVNLSIIIIPFVVISVTALALVLIPHYRINNLAPLLGEGSYEIIKDSFFKMGGYFEILFLLIFSKYMKNNKDFKKSGLLGIGAIALTVTAFTLIYCASIPYPASKYFFFPLYQLTRLVKAGVFMQRLEPLVVFVWAGIVLCALTTVTIGACDLFKSSAGEKHISPFVPLTVMIMFFIGVIPESEAAVYETYRIVLNLSHYFYIAAIFIILLTARGRKIEKA